MAPQWHHEQKNKEMECQKSECFLQEKNGKILLSQDVQH